MSYIISRLSRHSLLLLCALFLFLRLFRLTLLPIFGDEAIYLEWGWRMLHTASPFFSLYDAKPPLLMWLFGISQMFFSDPLFAGRLVSIIASLVTLLGLFFTSRRLYNLSVAYIACLMYIFIPIFSFYDRQALMESAISAIVIWSFYLHFQLISQPKIITAFLFGCLIGLGLLIKTNALLLFLVFVITHLVFSVTRKLDLSRQLILIIFTTIGLFITALPILFQSEFWSTLSSNSRYSLTLFELLRLPLSNWLTNFTAAFHILFFLFTPFLFLTAILGWSSSHPLLKLWLIFLLSTVTLIIRYPQSRYLVSYLPLLILPAAGFISSRRPVWLLSLLPAVALTLLQLASPPVYFQLLSRLTPYSDSATYIDNPTSGYTTREIIKYLSTKISHQPAYVLYRVEIGNPESALPIYLRHYPFITTAFLDDRFFNSLDEIDCFTSDRPVYFVARRNMVVGLVKYLQPYTTISNPYNTDFSTIYTLKTPCTGNTIELRF